MLIKNTQEHYGIIAQGLHWLMFILIATMLTIGFIMEDFEGMTKLKMIGFHKATGICVLFLAVLRLSWRLINTTPGLPASMPAYQKFGAHAVHWFLYGLMIFLPVTGWMMSSAAGFPVSVYGLFTMPMVIESSKEIRMLMHDLHEIGVNVFLAVGALHILAALAHHFYFKDNTLIRMLRPAKKENA